MKELVYSTVLSNNFISQIWFLLLAFLIYGFMIKTKPKRSMLFSTLLTCTIASIITTVLQLYMSLVVSALGNDRIVFSKIYCSLFYIAYGVVLNSIYLYMHLLTHGNDGNYRVSHTIAIIFDICYMIACIYSISKPDYVVIESDTVLFAQHAYNYLIFGSICAYICLLNAIIHKDTLPRIIYVYSVIFTLLDIVVLNAQLMFTEVLFSAVTYVLPILIFYLLFHSNPIDENNGVRNEISFENEFHNLTSRNKKYILINIYFPFLKNDAVQNTALHQKIVARICRQIEKIDKSLEIYSRNSYSYIIYLDYKSIGEIENIVLQIQNIISAYTHHKYAKISLSNKIIVSLNSEYINSVKKYNSYIDYINNTYFKENADNEYYISTEKDYLNFKEYYDVYETLYDIRNSGNLEDERIICFAQPIYEVSSGKFRTAEALMRMKINDKLVYPDVFIPIAEKNNFIHILTCIMIDKVCKEIKKLEEICDFEAITVNCSTTEFDDISFNEEILDIIKSNDVEPLKIRIEITESNMVDTYKNIIYNMQRMKDSGIVCYLDDFGTGYSNFERIFGCPFNTVKFDKGLFYKSLEDPAMDEIMVSTIKAFKNKGFRVLVEGIEDEEQNKICINKGFEYIQGYFYSRPVPIEKMAEFFEAKMK